MLRSSEPQPDIGTGLLPVTIAIDQRDRTSAWGVHAANRDPDCRPSAATAAMLFWTLMVPGQISMRKIDGGQTLPAKPLDQQIDFAA